MYSRHNNRFFDLHKARFEAPAFDDALNIPGYSNVLPANVDLTTRLTRNINGRIGIFSAAMSTVTEESMAIALAKLGGCGVIHRALTPEDHSKKVARVKYELNGLIETPITARDTMTVQELINRQETREASGKTVFHTHPIVDSNDFVVGLITSRELRYCRDKNTTLGRIMIPRAEVVMCKPGTSAKRVYETMYAHKVSAVLVVDRKRKLHGMYVFSDLVRKFENDGNGFNVDAHGQLIVAAAIGTGPLEFERAEMLVRRNCNILVVDSAHGNSRAVLEMIRKCKRAFDVDVIAGNVAWDDGALAIAKAGADAIKVGIGPGSICTTRDVAAAGVSQLTAIHWASRVARRYGVPVIADGGMRGPKELLLAFAAGAESGMFGSVLAGTDEAPGETFIDKGREVKRYDGMGSLTAMKQSAASRGRYRMESGKLVPEGVPSTVPYKGSVARVVEKLTGGVRSGFGYVGAANIREYHAKSRLVRITASGQRESSPHDVNVIAETD